MTPLFALLALQSATVDVAKDPLYAKPVTVEVSMAPLRTVVAALAKASGQTLDVSGVVGDWKATVLVKNLPAGKAMAALADTLGLVWRRDSDAVRLGWAEGASQSVDAYRKEEAARIKKQMDQMVSAGVVPAGGPGRPRFRRVPRETMIPGAPATGERPVVSRYEPNIMAIETGGGEPPTRLEPAAPSGDSAFAKAVMAWPSVPQELPAAWSAPVAPTLQPSKWTNGALTLADHLVAWHAASGLPVVADAFRVPLRNAAPTPGSAIGSLQALAEAERLGLKVADGVARLRHPAFWRLREQEIPESKWGTFERANPTTLASLSAFASGLTAPQAASFRSQESPVSLVATNGLIQAYPALLLWSALPGPARTALLSGQPVGLAQVRGATNAYNYALREAPYYDAGDPTPVLAMNPAQIGLFGKPSGKNLELRLAGERGNGVYYILPL